MKRTLLAALSLSLSAAWLAAPALAAPPGLPSAGVAWVPASSDAEVDRAFVTARAERKPVLLYWGASWCPPCNQLKATLFNRQDFAAQSRAFVAVHVDGDRPGAQKLGRRFKVSGYPTVVLFSPQGEELTRLPGEVDAAQMMAVLHLGLSNGRPVKRVLADALAARQLDGNEWRLLAFYSWDTDEAQLVPKAELPATLQRLAAAAPAADAQSSTRLWLKAVAAVAAAAEDGKAPGATAAAAVAPSPVPDASTARARLLRLLADPSATREQADVLAASAADITTALAAGAPAAERAALQGAVETAMKRLESDGALSRADRLGALIGRIDLARLALPKGEARVELPEPLRIDVREHAARADREITDGYERQAVVTAAAYALGHAGLWADSDRLLKTNLPKSHSPYYLMSQLGSNARKLGRTDEALGWYRQAFEASEGPATRLQWGAGYLAALVDLAPQDAQRIEKTASILLGEAAADSGAFDGRSLRSLQRSGAKLLAWQGEGRQGPVLRRLQSQLGSVCPKVEAADGQRAACEALLTAKPAANPKKAAAAA